MSVASDFVTTFASLAPVYFVLGLGYFAGQRRFDADKVTGIVEVTLDYAVPASLFVGIVTTPRQDLLTEGPFVLSLLIDAAVLYLAGLYLARRLFRNSIGASSLVALQASFPSAPFFGTSILARLFGSRSEVSVSIAISIVISILVLVPISMIMLEATRGPQPGNAANSSAQETHPSVGKQTPLRRLIGPPFLKAAKSPLIWAPLSGLVLALLGVKLPQIGIASFNLIGSTTGGLGVFVAGLALAASKLKLNREVALIAGLKNIAQPVLMIGLTVALGVSAGLTHQGIVLTSLGTATLPVLLAIRYQTYQSEASSTLFLSSILMILTLPLFIVLTS